MKRKLLNYFTKYKLCARFLGWLQLKRHLYNNKYKEFWQLINTFCDPDNIKNHKYIKKITKDAYFSNFYYKIGLKEYFLFDFEKLSHFGRKQFIGNIERHEIMDKIGNKETKEILNNKYKCYCKFKKFYKREIIKISNKEDKILYDRFCIKHSHFIVKPVNSSQGRGIYLIDLEKESISAVWKRILKDGECLLEEIIIQSDDLGKFHPKSVNTIRFATYIEDNKVTKLFSLLRIGQGNSIVDNASAGGILAQIDVETGIIMTYGKTKNGKIFLKHPDTNICIVGHQIQKWNELCEIIENVAHVLPEHNLVSWDFALTEKGWVMVEANAEGEFAGIQMFNVNLRKILKQVNKRSII